MPSFKSLILSSIVSSQLIFGFKVKPESAKHVLKSRTKRHNQNFFEETLASDMQRECYDEKCSLEEFVEAYENTDANARTTKSDQVQLAYDQLRKPCEFKACHSMNTLRCEQKWNNAECKCKEGWTGDLCEIDINECLIETNCQNGGTCENIPGSFVCTCTAGFEGTNCQNDRDECAENDNMCDHGTCINTFGSYECDCDKGWEGPACEFDIDECALDRASQQNLVVPETVVVGETNSTDYNSDYVEVKQDVFVSTLCPDPNSQCRNLPGTYECICKGGWTKGEFSDLCDEDLDECKYNVCPGNAKCGTPEFNMFTCECPEEGCAFEN